MIHHERYDQRQVAQTARVVADSLLHDDIDRLIPLLIPQFDDHLVLVVRRPILLPTLQDPCPNNCAKSLVKWSRPAWLFIKGVRPNSSA